MPAYTEPPAVRSLLETEAFATTVEVTGDQMTIRSPSRQLAASLQPGPVADGVFTLHLVAPGGPTRVVTVRVEGPDRLVIMCSASDGGGSLILQQDRRE